MVCSCLHHATMASSGARGVMIRARQRRELMRRDWGCSGQSEDSGPAPGSWDRIGISICRWRGFASSTRPCASGNAFMSSCRIGHEVHRKGWSIERERFTVQRPGLDESHKTAPVPTSICCFGSLFIGGSTNGLAFAHRSPVSAGGRRLRVIISSALLSMRASIPPPLLS